MKTTLNTSCLRSLAAVGLAIASAAAQATDYNVTTLTGAPGESVQVFDVNNSGQAAVSIATATGQQAFVYSGGAYSAISGPTGALGASAIGLSDTGLVVGSYYTTTSIDPDTGELVLGPQTGYVFDGSGYTNVAVPGAIDTFARGISPDGRYVTGFYANLDGNFGFVLDRTSGIFTPLSTPDSVGTIAQGVNASGTVMGSDIITGPSGATRPGFTFDIASGARTDYLFAGYRRTAFRDIDASGRMVGWLQTLDPGTGALVSVGFVGTPDSFETLQLSDSGTTFIQGTNDAGWISGTYNIGDVSVGFLAIPVPEPQTWALMLGGVALLAWRRRR